MTDWIKPFVIANLYRTDLTRLGLTHEQIATLSDMDMLTITQQLQVLYLESVFLPHLGSAVNNLFLKKEQKDHGTVDTGA